MFVCVLVQIGDPRRSTLVSQMLMDKYNIYVQDINYPTVARGQESLRIVPTPFHTQEMQDKFVEALVKVWHVLELPFTKMQWQCSYYENYELLGGSFNLNLPLLPAMA